MSDLIDQLYYTCLPVSILIFGTDLALERQAPEHETEAKDGKAYHSKNSNLVEQLRKVVDPIIWILTPDSNEGQGKKKQKQPGNLYGKDTNCNGHFILPSCPMFLPQHRQRRISLPAHYRNNNANGSRQG
jgi:hypothetical protein